MPDPWPLLAVNAGAYLPYGLAFARGAGLAGTAPALSSSGLGWRLRIALAMLVAVAIAPSARAGTPTTLDPARLGWILAAEVVAGAMLGLSASLVLAGARQAGELIGMQAGLSPAAWLDPETGSEGMNPVGHLYGGIALGAFLALDGPLQLVKALAESYRAIPPGGLGLSVETVDALFGRVGWSLALALRASAPVGLALMAAGAAVGLLGRAAPSLSLLSYALPIRVGVGLLLVLAGVGAAAGLFAMAWSEIL